MYIKLLLLNSLLFLNSMEEDKERMQENKKYEEEKLKKYEKYNDNIKYNCTIINSIGNNLEIQRDNINDLISYFEKNNKEKFLKTIKKIDMDSLKKHLLELKNIKHSEVYLNEKIQNLINIIEKKELVSNDLFIKLELEKNNKDILIIKQTSENLNEISRQLNNIANISYYSQFA